MPGLPQFTMDVLEFMATLFVFAVGTFLVVLLILYFYDKYQTANSVRRNYPVVGRFRGGFEYLGEFFRQYFFAMDPRNCRSTGRSASGRIALPWTSTTPGPLAPPRT